MLLFHILQKNYLNKICIFFEDLVSYTTSVPYMQVCYHYSHLTSLCSCHVITHCRLRLK